MIKRFKIFLLIIFLIPFCMAFDFQRSSFKDAIKTGKTVFVANVQSASVISNDIGAVKALANLIIEDCLYGHSCKKIKSIRLIYLAQVLVGTSLPVNFPVGERVIVVLSGDISNETYEFDSDINGGVDYVYNCDIFPFTADTDLFSCRDMMINKTTGWLSLKKIHEYISEKK